MQTRFSRTAKKVGVAQRRITSSEIDCLSTLAKTGQTAFSSFFHSPSNGLVYARNRLRGQAITAHISLSKGERSALAEMGAKMM